MLSLFLSQSDSLAYQNTRKPVQNRGITGTYKYVLNMVNTGGPQYEKDLHRRLAESTSRNNLIRSRGE